MIIHQLFMAIVEDLAVEAGEFVNVATVIELQGGIILNGFQSVFEGGGLEGMVCPDWDFIPRAYEELGLTHLSELWRQVLDQFGPDVLRDDDRRFERCEEIHDDLEPVAKHFYRTDPDPQVEAAVVDYCFPRSDRLPCFRRAFLSLARDMQVSPGD